MNRGDSLLGRGGSMCESCVVVHGSAGVAGARGGREVKAMGPLLPEGPGKLLHGLFVFFGIINL